MSDLLCDGGIANLTHMSKEYGPPVQFKCI
jgi:hypothetical protein